MEQKVRGPPRVGVAAIVRNARREMLLGKRAGSHGAGTWQFPGGHLEAGEGFVECAEREVLEETGLKVKQAAGHDGGSGSVVAVTNDVFEEEGKHYITVFVELDVDVGPGEEAVAKVMESEKCECWVWKAEPELRAMKEAGEKCFLPIVHILEEHENLDSLVKLSRPKQGS